jgi:hypothetical protein
LKKENLSTYRIIQKKVEYMERVLRQRDEIGFAGQNVSICSTNSRIVQGVG